MDDIKILKGNIIYAKTKDEFEICEHGYLVCKDGKVEGIYQTLPFRLGGEPIEDHGDCLIIPGMTDLHIHAPQYTFRGTGMDLELLECWRRIHFRRKQNTRMYYMRMRRMRSLPRT